MVLFQIGQYVRVFAWQRSGRYASTVRWVNGLAMLVVCLVAATSCGSSKTYLVRGNLDGVTYDAWLRGSQVCQAYTGVGSDNDTSCETPVGPAPIPRVAVYLELGQKILFGLGPLRFAYVRVLSEDGAQTTVVAHSAPGNQAWTYFVSPAPRDDTIATIQLLDAHRKALGPPRAEHFEGPFAGDL